MSWSRVVSAAIACDLSPFSRTCVRASVTDEEKGFGRCSQMKGIEEMAPDNSPGAHGEVGLTGTSATADCRACACASRVARVVEVVRLALHERVQHQTAEHIERWSKKPTFVFLRWRRKLSRCASCHKSASLSTPRSASPRTSWE